MKIAANTVKLYDPGHQLSSPEIRSSGKGLVLGAGKQYNFVTALTE
jgi:hypothetical protein